MKTPDKIYIPDKSSSNGYFSVNRSSVSNLEYIRKDALLEWANGMSKAVATLGEELSFRELIEHIKSL